MLCNVVVTLLQPANLILNVTMNDGIPTALRASSRVQTTCYREFGRRNSSRSIYRVRSPSKRSDIKKKILILTSSEYQARE
jgi:hypothetical protein